VKDTTTRRFLGYSFPRTNPIRFEIPVGCSIEKFKDVIKQVAPIRVFLMKFTNQNWSNDYSLDS